MDLYIQFRHTRPTGSNAVIGDVINVYTDAEITESPSLTSNLAWIKIVGLPDSQGKRKLKNLLAGRVDKANDDYRRNANFNFASLPAPYKKRFNDNKETDVPFGIAISLLNNNKLGRSMQSGDFD